MPIRQLETFYTYCVGSKVYMPVTDQYTDEELHTFLLFEFFLLADLHIQRRQIQIAQRFIETNGNTRDL